MYSNAQAVIYIFALARRTLPHLAHLRQLPHPLRPQQPQRLTQHLPAGHRSHPLQSHLLLHRTGSHHCQSRPGQYAGRNCWGCLDGQPAPLHNNRSRVLPHILRHILLLHFRKTLSSLWQLAAQLSSQSLLFPWTTSHNDIRSAIRSRHTHHYHYRIFLLRHLPQRHQHCQVCPLLRSRRHHPRRSDQSMGWFQSGKASLT